MEHRADILLISPPPQTERIAVVDVNNRMGLSAAHARGRESLLRTQAGFARFFMLVSQDNAFVWNAESANYAHRIPMGPVIHRFLPNLQPGKRLYDFQLQTIISTWLTELAAGWRDATEGPERKLQEIGFLQAIRGARIHSEIAA